MEDAPAFRDFKTPRIALFVACSEPLFSRILINIELNISSVAHQQGKLKAEFPEHPTTRIPISSSSFSVKSIRIKHKGAIGAVSMDKKKGRQSKPLTSSITA